MDKGYRLNTNTFIENGSGRFRGTFEAEEIEVFRTCCKKRRGGDKVLELKLGRRKRGRPVK